MMTVVYEKPRAKPGRHAAGLKASQGMDSVFNFQIPPREEMAQWPKDKLLQWFDENETKICRMMPDKGLAFMLLVFVEMLREERNKR